LAEIIKTSEHYPSFAYRVEWEDNDGVGRERYFKSYRSAERFAVEVEVEMFNQANVDLQNALSLRAKTELTSNGPRSVLPWDKRSTN
jgi:hypothetical protein